MPNLIYTSDGSMSLYSEQFGEAYHSTHGAVTESRHVFVMAGLRYLLEKQTTQLNILEVGFGTGLNALLTFLEAENSRLKIHYTGIEPFPIDLALAKQLNYPSLLGLDAAQKDCFIQMHDLPMAKTSQLGMFFSLTKVANTDDLMPQKSSFDLIYFDAFAPNVQPELWTTATLQTMYECLRVGGVLVTYCAKGVVKRTLRELGFLVEGLPGPPRKREMTRAIK